MKKIYDLRVWVNGEPIATIAHNDKVSKKYYSKLSELKNTIVEFKKTGSYTWTH